MNPTTHTPPAPHLPPTLFPTTFLPTMRSASVPAAAAALLAVLAAPLVAPTVSAQAVTGLSSWSVVLDPGHGGGAGCGSGTSGCENTGVFGYSETEKALGVGLELEALLRGQTDIGAVYMTRRSNLVNPSLADRVTLANQSGASYFHSIHSNAADATARSLFVLWPQDGATNGEPALYPGGRRMAQTMGPILGRAMRVPLSNGGAWGECDFYGACQAASPTFPKGSRNYVQRYTTMPSTLSEASFHTNPTQNQLNMSVEWKRMEARAMFYAMLRFRDVARPASRIVQGIVQDVELGTPINGAIAEASGLRDTTDTYEGLFRRFTTDRELLRNGFYYLENLPAGAQTLAVTAPGYEPASVSVTPVDTFFTFRDVGLVSSAPVRVATLVPATPATNVRVVDPVVVSFNRPVTRASLQSAFSLAPSAGGAAVAGTFTWTSDNRRVTFQPGAALSPFTEYRLALDGTVVSPYGYGLDGNSDGTTGDAFRVLFTTGPQDVLAPRITGAFPANNSTGLEQRPLLTLAYDESIDPATFNGSMVRLVRTSDQVQIPVSASLIEERGQSVLHVVPSQPLRADAFHQLTVAPGLGDAFGNRTSGEARLTYRVGTAGTVYTPIDNFDGDFTANWWQPTQSGSTTAASINADSTFIRRSTTVGNPLTGTTGSMELRYGWAANATTASLIRQYLNSGTPFTTSFDSTSTLETYVYGDGGGSLFRFSVDDACGSSHGSCAGNEVNEWTKITWKGWRRVSWRLGAGTTARWLGTANGVLDGRLYIDSYQIGYDTGAATFGRLYFDDLRTSKATTPVGAEAGAGLPAALALDAVAPNPVRGRADVRFHLPEAMTARVSVYDALGRHVATLLDGSLGAGTHETRLDADGLAPGVYLIRLEAGTESRTTRAVVVR